MSPPFLCHLLGVVCPAAYETYQWLDLTSNGFWAENRLSPVVGLLPLACGQMKYMRKTVVYCWRDYKTEIAKELNITTGLYKTWDYRRNWIWYVNRMPHNRLPRIIKSYTPKEKVPGETTEETSGCVRMEQVKSGPTPW